MKVVQINTLGKTMSTGRTTREMHDYFIKHHIISYIACPTNIDCNDAFFFSNRISMKLDAALTCLTGLEAYHSRRSTKKLIRFLDRVSPDIVHLRILHSNYINLQLLFKYLSDHNVCTVITFHDFWFITGKCCFYSNIRCYKWQTGCTKCKMQNIEGRPYFFERSNKMWKNKMNLLSSIPNIALVGVSDWVVNEIKKSPISNHAIVKRIYNWIDLHTFFPRETNLLRKRYSLLGKFVILGVSTYWRHNDRKGFDVYLKLAKNMPSNYSILLIGNIVETVILPDNIVAVGKVDNKDLLSEYYSLADVYLNLSTEETFGKVSAEALACGTPVAALDATANKELITDQTGVIFSSRNVDEILRNLSIIEKKGKSFFTNNCRNFSKNNFDMEENINLYLELYESMLKEKYDRGASNELSHKSW